MPPKSRMRPSLLGPKVSRMYFLIMAAHDPITNEEFSSTLSLSLSLSLGNIELLLKGIQTQTYEGNITAVDFNAGNGRTCGWLRSVADSALGDAITQSLTFSYYYCSAVFIMYYCASLSPSLSSSTKKHFLSSVSLVLSHFLSSCFLNSLFV